MISVVPLIILFSPETFDLHTSGCYLRRVKIHLFPIFFCLCLFSTAAIALPRYAVQEGVGCVSCHVNPTGAGKRNDYGGRLFSQDLSLEQTRHLVPDDFKARVAKFLSLGTDIRAHNTTTLGAPATNNFTVPQASLYAEINAGKYLTGYIDHDLANTFNRESFVMLNNLPSKFHVKAGRMNLPYGLRLDDATSPIRANFNMTFVNQDIGMEAGIMPGPFEFLAAVSNGVPGGVADENLAKAYTASANWIGKQGRVGASFHWNKRATAELVFGGLNGGFTVWNLTALGEVDVQRSRSRTGGGNTAVIAGYGELNWQVIEGLYVKATYDVLDPDVSAANNFQHRLGTGFDLYPLPYAQISLLYRYNTGPSATGDNQILARVHFFF